MPRPSGETEPAPREARSPRAPEQPAAEPSPADRAQPSTPARERAQPQSSDAPPLDATDATPPGPTRDQAAPPTTPGTPRPGDRPALQSTSEADGTSVSKALPYQFKPGQIRARAGLSVTTVRPRFSLTTQVLGLARNTFVRIKFKRDGRVKDVEFLDSTGFAAGTGTGNPSVDGPLKFALYAWTAKGRELDRLPPNDPDATADMVIKIIFRPEHDDSADNP